ncbi:MAG: PIN domain-containing protein [Sulfurovum sp.]|nr:PIN domain-containing protein [Sulfurovum sp.]
MMNKYDLNNIQNIGNRKVFFDANILLYLYWSTNLSWQERYSQVYSKLIDQNNPFVLHYVVISEFINRAIKIEYSNYLRENNITNKDFSYKSYRDSEAGIEAQEDIYTLVQAKILKEFEVVNKNLSTNDIENMLIVDSLDFSDKLINQVCKDNNYVLLTNDRDFKDTGIDILTLNRNI